MAQDRSITVYALETIVKKGFLKYILPKFSLKHSIFVGVSQDRGQEDTIFHILKGSNTSFSNCLRCVFLSLQEKDKSEFAEAFKDCLTSKVGENAIKSFTFENGVIFPTEFQADVMQTEIAFLIDTTLGHQLATQNCGRCQAIVETKLKKTIGSIPSFAAL